MHYWNAHPQNIARGYCVTVSPCFMIYGWMRPNLQSVKKFSSSILIHLIHTALWNINHKMNRNLSHETDINSSMMLGIKHLHYVITIPDVSWLYVNNRPISQVPQCIRKYSTMHHFVTEMCTRAHFCYKTVYCWIWYWCTVRILHKVFSFLRLSRDYTIFSTNWTHILTFDQYLLYAFDALNSCTYRLHIAISIHCCES